MAWRRVKRRLVKKRFLVVVQVSLSIFKNLGTSLVQQLALFGCGGKAATRPVSKPTAVPIFPALKKDTPTVCFVLTLPPKAGVGCFVPHFLLRCTVTPHRGPNSVYRDFARPLDPASSGAALGVSRVALVRFDKYNACFDTCIRKRDTKSDHCSTSLPYRALFVVVHLCFAARAGQRSPLPHVLSPCSTSVVTR